jgi:hypothetical protein
MLAGVATRRHVLVGEPVGQTGTAVSKSAVSRRFVAATTAAVAELLEADLAGLDTAVLMIDGLNVAGEMIVVALVITADGTKVPVGLRLGDTENSVVVKDLLADLVDRGLRFEHGILAVLDGSKALRKGVTKVFGTKALVQRCTLHKRRNVIDYLPVARRKAMDKRLAKIFAEADASVGLAEARRLAMQLKPGSSRRGRVTARRLGGDVHCRPARHHRRTTPIVDEHELHRVDDRHRPRRHRPGQELARRRHEEAMDRDRHDRSPTLLPPRPRPHPDDRTRHPDRPHRQPCNTHHLHSRSCLRATPGSPPHFNNKRDILPVTANFFKPAARSAAQRPLPGCLQHESSTERSC